MPITRKEAREAINFLRAAERLPLLYEAKHELGKLRTDISKDVAPGSAKKIRAAQKSIEGAIRNAMRFTGGQHIKIGTGFCRICGHHGSDCEGTLGPQAEHDARVRAEFPELYE